MQVLRIRYTFQPAYWVRDGDYTGLAPDTNKGRIVMRSISFAIAVIVAVLVITETAKSEESPVWQPLAEKIVGFIDEAEVRYQEGDAKAAQRAVVEAYFGVFEDRKMEAAMRTTIGAKHTYLVEKQFGSMRKAIKNRESPDIVNEIAEGIRQAMRRDAKVLDEADIPTGVFRVNQ